VTEKRRRGKEGGKGKIDKREKEGERKGKGLKEGKEESLTEEDISFTVLRTRDVVYVALVVGGWLIEDVVEGPTGVQHEGIVGRYGSGGDGEAGVDVVYVHIRERPAGQEVHDAVRHGGRGGCDRG